MLHDHSSITVSVAKEEDRAWHMILAKKGSGARSMAVVEEGNKARGLLKVGFRLRSVAVGGVARAGPRGGTAGWPCKGLQDQSHASTSAAGSNGGRRCC